MDANSHRGTHHEGSLHLKNLGAGLRELGLASCFGDPPDEQMVGEIGFEQSLFQPPPPPPTHTHTQVTTCMARTFLQPQFNKVSIIREVIRCIR